MIRSYLFIACLFISCIIPASISASTWIDPYFDDAVHESGLICIGNVITGRSDYSEIEIIKIYKGKQSVGDTIKIMRAEAGEGHEEDKLPENRQFFFMVLKDGEAYKAFTDTYWIFMMNDSLIRVPIRDPLTPCTMFRSDFDPFLEYMIARDKNETYDLHKQQSLINISEQYLSSTNPLTKDPEAVDHQFFGLEVLHYLGTEKQSALAVKFITSPYYHIRWQAVRAMEKCGGKISEDALLSLLANEDTRQVQTVLGKVIFDLELTSAKTILEEKIPELDTEIVFLSSDVMNPVFNTIPAPRYSYAAALMRLEGIKGSYDELVEQAKKYIYENKNIKLNILEGKREYTSLEDALKEPDNVYILSLYKDSLKTVPESIKNFRNLKKLDLMGNALTSLPLFIKDFGLIELNIHDNQFATIPDIVFECTTLEILNIGDNPINELNPKIGDLTNLTELILPSCKIPTLPESIGRLSNLKRLNCRMADIEYLPKSFSQLDNLNWVELYGNNFFNFPEELIGCDALKEIEIGSNEIKYISPEVVKAKNLKYVDLSYNFLSFDERMKIKNFPPGIIFSLEGNYDTYYDVDDVAGETDKSRIKGLNDAHQDYAGLIIDLTGLNAATYVDLEHDMLNDFPKGITSMASLTAIYLSDNNISQFPEDVCKMTKLTNLYLNHNKLSELPENIGCLISLQYLFLSDNQLDSIPASVGDLSKLITLNLSNNKLTSLPDNLSNLSIKYLYLAGNNFSAEEKTKINSWYGGHCAIEW